MTRDGEPWFVAKDVCVALGLEGYASQHTARLSSDELFLATRDSRTQNTTLPEGIFDFRAPKVALVSESGLYKLVMRSDKPAAKAFQDWVTREVLPSMRIPAKTALPALHQGQRAGATAEGVVLQVRVTVR